ncbi:hypothetical protein MMC18_005091 [Xylographa bjoerkii]|nr:hypothetical protein [Xylographa bjoerkii]
MSHSSQLHTYPEPEVRSNVTATADRKQPVAEFSAGNEVRMKNPKTGLRDWIMVVVTKLPFNEDKWRWEYEVKSKKEGIKYDRSVAQGELEEA